MSLAISAYRQAGDQIEDVDVDPNADIETSKLGTRTLYRSIPPAAFMLSGSSVAFTNNNVFPAITMPDANAGNIYVSLPMPDEWDEASDITINIIWQTSATAGNAVLNASAASRKEDGAMTSEVSGSATTAAQGTANRIQISSIALAAANFAKGDIIGLNISRDGTAVGDTIAADLRILAVYIEFTGQG